MTSVAQPTQLTPLDPAYPSRLRSLPRPPASLTVRGGSVEAEHVVAIVGSRAAHADTMSFARELAARLVRAGVVVASGGAIGIDASAHGGALDAKGRTWVVAPTGHNRCFPAQHAELFEAIGRGPGAMLWPFAPDYEHRSGFILRNRVLVALSDAVVVVQAGARSGALHAAACARKLGTPLWVVPAPPWRQQGFEGTHDLIDRMADRPPGQVEHLGQLDRPRALTSIDKFLATLGLGVTGAAGSPARPLPTRPLSTSEAAVLSGTSTAPLHLDEIASRSHSAAGTVAAVLLTLVLEDVVVEGPPGFFRRRDGR